MTDLFLVAGVFFIASGIFFGSEREAVFIRGNFLWWLGLISLIGGAIINIARLSP